MPPKTKPSKIDMIVTTVKLVASSKKMEGCRAKHCKPELDRINEKNKPLLAKANKQKQEIRVLVADLRQGKVLDAAAKAKMRTCIDNYATILENIQKQSASMNPCMVKHCSPEIMVMLEPMNELLRVACDASKSNASAAQLLTIKKDVSAIVNGKRKLDAKSYSMITDASTREMLATLKKLKARLR
jgi:hypothetical protein